RFDEALTELHKAEGVDPLAPLWPAFTGAAATWMRRPADAQPAIARSLALDPDFPIGLYIAAEALANAGRNDSALATAARAHGRNPGWQFIVGWALARAGRRQEALALARNLEAAPSAMDKWGIAQIYAGLGDADQAMRWLEAAYEARWNWMPWMDYNPGFVPIRGDPRFRVLMRKVGAPPCAVCGLPVAPTRAASGASTAQ
ncbi:MAG TPA: hypothetical protein PK948_08365, partial [Gemmatimonadales bacterium]|nr:hypothetical protein [Gemmatimonadales bacterium]